MNLISRRMSRLETSLRNRSIGQSGSAKWPRAFITRKNGRWSMIDFKCGQCGEEMEAPQSLAGETENCPKCGKRNHIPGLAVPGDLCVAAGVGQVLILKDLPTG
jgi:hypothetical protein